MGNLAQIDYRELRINIDKNPLTRKDFVYLIRKNIDGIVFTKQMKSDGLLLPSKSGKYLMKVNSNQSEDEQKKTLVHEAIHLKYNLLSLNCFQAMRIEPWAEELTKLFYEKNKNFIDLYYKNIFENWEQS